MDRLLGQPRAGQRDRRPARRASCSSTATSPTSCCTTTSAACRCCSTRSTCSGSSTSSSSATMAAAACRPRGKSASSASWTTGCSRCATWRTLSRTSCCSCPDDAARRDRLCELNVMVQARRVCRTTIVQQAWERGQPLTVHAWVYSLSRRAAARPRVLRVRPGERRGGVRPARRARHDRRRTAPLNRARLRPGGVPKRIAAGELPRPAADSVGAGGRLSPRGTTAAARCGSGGAACAAPWPRSGGCARG